MDIEQLSKMIQEYFMELSNEHISILKKYKTKCQMCIEYSKFNNGIKSKLIDILEQNMRELKRKLNKTTQEYYAIIYNYVRENEDKNNLVMLVEELKKDKLSNNLKKELDEFSYQIKSYITRTLVNYGISEKELEDFMYQFKRIAKSSIDKVFDDSNLISLNYGYTNQLDEMIINNNQLINTKEELEKDWHK